MRNLLCALCIAGVAFAAAQERKLWREAKISLFLAFTGTMKRFAALAA